MSGETQLPAGDASDIRDERLARFMDGFARALKEGVPTKQLESQILEDFGQQAQPKLRILKWLNSFDDAHTAEDHATPVSWGTGLILDEARLVFGRFEIIERVGAGGHGVVLRVFDSKLKREAALKLPRPDIVGQAALAKRFVKEGRAAAILNHPQILTIYDAGQTDDVPFILSVFCSGPNLAQWLRKQKEANHLVPPRLAAYWIMLVASGVSFAHSKGIAHRDLKPANILLMPTAVPNTVLTVGSITELPGGTSFNPQISDFGISKFDEEIWSADEHDFSSTSTGTVLGTLAYMAPEQAIGAKNIDYFASDIYSIGAILFEMLIGQPPLVGRTALESLRRLNSDEPPFPRDLRSDVPRDLEAICLKCLNRVPKQRYRTADELVKDLAGFLAGQRVSAPRTWRSLYYLRLLAGQRYPVWSTAIVLILVAMLGITLYGRLYLETKREHDAHIRDVSDVNEKLAEAIATQKTQADTLVSQESGRAVLYASDMQRADRIWQESRVLERDYPYAAADIKELLMRHIPLSGATDLRGFEWHYLWRCCEPERFAYQVPRVGVFAGHTNDVYQAEFTRDSKRLVTASADKTIRVWDVETRRPLQTFFGHTNEINGISLSGDDRWLASASDDGTVRVWDVQSGHEVHTFTGHQAPVVAVGFHPRLLEIYSADSDGIIKVWSVEQKSEICSTQGHAKRIQSLFVYPQERDLQGLETPIRQIITSSEDSIAHIWDLSPSPENTLKRLKSFRFDYNLEFFRIGVQTKVLAILGYTQHNLSKIEFCREGNSCRFSYEIAARLQSGAFAVNETQFLVAGRSTQVRAIDIATKKSWPLTAPLQAWSISTSRDGRYFATGEKDGNVTLWDYSTTTQHTILPNRPRNPESIEFSGDGRWIFVGGRKNSKETETVASLFSLWDLQVSPPVPRDLTITSAADESCQKTIGVFSPDGHELLVVEITDADKSIWRIFDLEAFTETRTFRKPFNKIEQIIFANDQIHCRFNEGADAQIVSFDAQNGHEVRKMAVRANAHRAAISFNGKLLAYEDNQHFVQLYNLAEGAPGNRWKMPFAEGGNIAISPRSNHIVVAGPLGKSRLLNVSDGEVCCEINGDLQEHYGIVDFSSDESRLVTGNGASNTIDLWSIPDGHHLLALRLPAHSRKVRSLRMSQDGKTIAAIYISKRPDPELMNREVEETSAVLWQVSGHESSREVVP